MVLFSFRRCLFTLASHLQKGRRERYPLQVRGAYYDWVALDFEDLPADVCRFAEEVYEFCPDSVEQGVGLMQESKHPEAFAEARALCPELSPAMQAKLDERKKQFEVTRAKYKLPPPALTTSTEMGIRLLARHIQTTKSLFLWWD